MSHPTLGWLKVRDDVAFGSWEPDQQPFSFPYRLSFVDWLRPVVKGRGVGVTQAFFVTFGVSLSLCFGSGTWFILSLVGPTGVVESSLEAPSSSADVRVCSQVKTGLVLGDLKFCLEFVLVTRRLAGGWLFRHIGGRCGNRMDGGRAGSVCMFGLLSFCRVTIVV
jgi:hypothetical protein